MEIIGKPFLNDFLIYANNQKKASWSIDFQKIFAFLLYEQVQSFFPTVQKNTLKGCFENKFKRINCFIAHFYNFNSLFQPCDLFELGLFIIERISSSFIFNDESRLSVLMVRGGKILVFDNGIHGDAKNIIKDVGFL